MGHVTLLSRDSRSSYEGKVFFPPFYFYIYLIQVFRRSRHVAERNHIWQLKVSAFASLPRLERSLDFFFWRGGGEILFDNSLCKRYHV